LQTQSAQLTLYEQKEVERCSHLSNKLCQSYTTSTYKVSSVVRIRNGQ